MTENPKIIGQFEWPRTKENMLMGLCPMNYHIIKKDEWEFGDAKKLHGLGYLEEAKRVNEILSNKLKRWQQTHEEHFKLSYTYDTIIINTENILEWNKELHDELCSEFHVILVEHNKIETYQHNQYKFECRYIYLAWIDTNGIPELEKSKKKYNLNWNEINL